MKKIINKTPKFRKFDYFYNIKRYTHHLYLKMEDPSWNAFVAKLKSELRIQIISELRSALDGLLASPDPAVVVVAPNKVAVADVIVTYSKSSDFSKFEKNDKALKCFTIWFNSHNFHYNHLKHAFNSLVKHEKFININLTNETITTDKNTWNV